MSTYRQGSLQVPFLYLFGILWSRNLTWGYPLLSVGSYRFNPQLCNTTDVLKQYQYTPLISFWWQKSLFSHMLLPMDSMWNEVSGVVNIGCKNLFRSLYINQYKLMDLSAKPLQDKHKVVKIFSDC